MDQMPLLDPKFPQGKLRRTESCLEEVGTADNFQMRSIRFVLDAVLGKRLIRERDCQPLFIEPHRHALAC